MAQRSMRRWMQDAHDNGDAAGLGGRSAAAEAAPEAAGSEVVAYYGDYASAQRAVDDLSDSGFPVARVSIVGEGLQLVEDVTGRMGYGRAILQGAATGALTGALIGLLFGLFTWFDPLVSGLALGLWGLILGAVVGGLLGAAGHFFSGGRRDFSSIERLSARRYNLVVDRDVADEAERVLARMPEAPR